jgi:hypothetical protein
MNPERVEGDPEFGDAVVGAPEEPHPAGGEASAERGTTRRNVSRYVAREGVVRRDEVAVGDDVAGLEREVGERSATPAMNFLERLVASCHPGRFWLAETVIRRIHQPAGRRKWVGRSRVTGTCPACQTFFDSAFVSWRSRRPHEAGPEAVGRFSGPWAVVTMVTLVVRSVSRAFGDYEKVLQMGH